MKNISTLDVAKSHAEELSHVEECITHLYQSNGNLKILEAGCGRQWELKLKGVEYHLTGLDMDAEALRIRVESYKDLDDVMLGDLRTVSLPNQSFDVIYNSFVLEHVAGAELVMERFLAWLKPGGVIILRIPDPDSVQGFVTRVTPHWFHVLYYRLILGMAKAGSPGYPPYPTYYDPIVSRAGITAFCCKHSLQIERTVADGYYRPGRGHVQILIAAVKRLIATLSFGRLSDKHTNLLYLLKKT